MSNAYERGMHDGERAVQNSHLTPESITSACLDSIEHLPKNLDTEEQKEYLLGRIAGANAEQL